MTLILSAYPWDSGRNALAGCLRRQEVQRFGEGQRVTLLDQEMRALHASREEPSDGAGPRILDLLRDAGASEVGK